MKVETLHFALEGFSRHTGLVAEAKESPHSGWDGEFLLMSPRAGKFPYVLKSRLTVANWATTVALLERAPNALLIAEHISKPLKERLKEQQLNYLDAAGNVFMTDYHGLYLYVETNKTYRASKEPPNRAFSKAGLKVVYQILTDELIVNQAYRQIGAQAQVSIDTVGKVIRELLRDQYLVRLNDKAYRLVARERLLEEWVTVFNKVLRPKLRQKKFAYRGGQLQDLMNILPRDGMLGGELAAEYLSQYLIAEHATIYTNTSFVELARQLDLIPDNEGRVTLIEKFWSPEQRKKEDLSVHPILVYADLLNNPTPRNLETSKIVYDRYIHETTQHT